MNALICKLHINIWDDFHSQCLEVLEDNEEAVLKELMNEETPTDVDIRVCALSAKYCDETLPEEDYVLEEDDTRDEL